MPTRLLTSFALALVTSLAAGAIHAEEKMLHARGEFDVQVTPKELDGPTEDPGLTRFALVKELRGDFSGKGYGQMLASGGPEQAAGAYVAIERITGTLNGKEGSFVLQHRGTKDASGYKLEVTVVPGSGTGDLEGIRGTFRILIKDGEHRYDLEYELP